MRLIDGLFTTFVRSPFYPYALFFRNEKNTRDLLKAYGAGLAVDIGCGSSNFRQFCLSDTGIRSYVGLDYPAWLGNLSRGDGIADKSGFVRRLLRHRPVQPDVWGDGCRLPMGDGCVDTTLSLGVLEHVPDYERYVSEVGRVLKEGGHLVMSIPFLYQAHGGVDERDDFARWTKAGITGLLKKHDLAVVEVRSYGGVGTTLAQLVNSYAIKKCKVYDARWFVLKCAVLCACLPLFFVANVAGALLDTFDRDPAYACGFQIVARRTPSNFTHEAATS